MKAEQIYKKIKEIANPIHSHQDQMMAISKWIEDEFEPKVTPANIGSGMFGTLKIREGGGSGGESCSRKEKPMGHEARTYCLFNNELVEYYKQFR